MVVTGPGVVSAAALHAVPELWTVVHKPRIQCGYRNAGGWQCPLHPLEAEECCKFHLPT